VQLDQSSATSHQLMTDLYAFISCVVQPDTTTGDIVFVLQLKENAKFKRKGDDLFVEHTLSLTEALCGFQFPLTHLDGRQLLIKSSPGEIVKSGNCSSVFQTYVGWWSLENCNGLVPSSQSGHGTCLNWISS
jgi:hypothetical protein